MSTSASASTPTSTPAPTCWWIDTNLVVRLVTGEPPSGAEEAARFFEAAGVNGLTLRLDPLVVAEALCVLTSFYRLPRGRAVESLLAVAQLPALRLEDRSLVVRALGLHATHPKLHFVDAWLAARAEVAGEGVATFDAGLQKSAGVPMRSPSDLS